MAQSDSLKLVFEEFIGRSKSLRESSPDSALTFGKQALLIAEQLESDSLKSSAHVLISVAYSYLGQFQVAIENSFAALKYAEAEEDTVSMIDAYNNLGIDFMYQEDYASSEKYFHKVEQLASSFGDTIRWGHALNNLGLLAGYQEEIQQELSYYQRARELFEIVGEHAGYANTLMNEGTVFTVMKRYDEAADRFEEALEVYQKLDYQGAVEQTLQSMAENHLAQGKPKAALIHALRALEVARNHSFTQDLPYIYALLAEIHAALNQYRQAYEFHQKRYAINDSIFTSEKSLQINELKAKYEAEKQQQQIELLTTQKQLTELNLLRKKREQYAFVFIIALILILGGLVVNILVSKSKLKQRLMAREIDNLQLNINSLVEGNTDGLDIKLDKLNQRLIMPLTDREFEILLLAVGDKSNGEIANEIHVSVNTVKFHLKNIYEKLGVTNRKEARQFAINPTKS